MNVPPAQPSKLLLDECFSAADERFLETLRTFSSYEYLRSFTERWIADPRPWARAQVVRYLQAELDAPGHEVVVKRLFKHFEAAADHEMMGHFLVACDRLVRRSRRSVAVYDPESGRCFSQEVLFARPNQVPPQSSPHAGARGRHQQPRPTTVPRDRPSNRLFTQRTRNYLRRRTWRYFRRLSYRKPAAYVAAVSAALCDFTDDDFARGENIVDNWSLMHACYFHHESIEFTAAHANLAAGHALDDLTPAPYQPGAWQSEKGMIGLLRIAGSARSSLVRIWAIELLQRDHRDSLAIIDMPTLKRLLGHDDPRVQEFAAQVFQSHVALSSLAIETWLELLGLSNPAVLTLLCDAFRHHVSPDRLDNNQLIELTSARPVPVARLGLELLQTRHAARPLPRQEVARLAAFCCPRLAGEATQWALQQIGTKEAYHLHDVIEFFDSLLVEMRTSAMQWLTQPSSPGYHDPVLWSRLTETPFDDVRFAMIECLERRVTLAGQAASQLPSIWAAVILGVQRGGRAKLKAVRQVGTAISRDPGQAERLLPVLAVATRSVRAPERRSALAAVAALVRDRPELRDSVRQALPELAWLELEEVG